MSKEFETKLNKKQDYGTGATRDVAAGKGRFDLIPDLALERVAKVYERGAEKHGKRNWEQGIPISRMIDSAIRHIRQYQMSKYIPELREEDHLAHAIWNLLGVLHEEEMIERGWLPEELDDLPRYGNKKGLFDIEAERRKLYEELKKIGEPGILETLSEEELRKVRLPTKEQITKALEKGNKEREAVERHWTQSANWNRYNEVPDRKPGPAYPDGPFDQDQ